MISYNEAKQKILSYNQFNHNIENCIVHDAYKKNSAETIYSNYNIPIFNSSAMDGFAIKYKKITQENKSQNLYFNVIGIQEAGMPCLYYNDFTAVHEYDAIQIMTGAIVPNNYDTIIKIEDISIIKKNNTFSILINKDIKQYSNIRFIGEDFNKNDLIIKKNVLIELKHIMALSSVGVSKIQVFKQVNTSLICTGGELTNSNNKLINGQIYNANGPYLHALLKKHDILINYYDNIADNYENIKKILKRNITSDIIITIGAVSLGSKDYIPNILSELKYDIIFHKIYIQPGKPLLFAKQKNGPFFFGLPGNPLATIICMRFFVYPFLQMILNKKQETPQKAKLLNNIQIKEKFTIFKKGMFFQETNTVKIINEQESFKISPLLKSNCWIILCKSKYYKNDLVEIYSLDF